jgi:hypothetical protein
MENLCCPACGEKLTLKQAIDLLNGSGYQRIAKVRLPDGRIDFLPAASVNPNEVEVLN